MIVNNIAYMTLDAAVGCHIVTPPTDCEEPSPRECLKDPKKKAAAYLDQFLLLTEVTKEDVSRFFQEKAVLDPNTEQEKIARCYAHIRASTCAKIAFCAAKTGAVVSKAIEELKISQGRLVPFRFYFHDVMHSVTKQTSVQIGNRCVFKRRSEDQVSEDKTLSSLFSLVSQPIRATFPIACANIQKLGVSFHTPLEKRLSFHLNRFSSDLQKAFIHRLNQDLELKSSLSMQDKKRMVEVYATYDKDFCVGPDLSSLSFDEVAKLESIAEDNFKEKKTGKKRSFRWLLEYTLSNSPVFFEEDDSFLQKILQLPWKVIQRTVSSEKLYAEEFQPHVTAYTLQQLGILEEVLDELSLEDIAKRIHCFEYQLLDNHLRNIAFCVEKEVAAQFKGWKFLINNEVVSFERLFLYFKQKTVTASAVCTYFDANNLEMKIGAISDIPGLVVALQTPYRLFIYDTGFSCGEDNLLQQVISSTGNRYHLVPVRDGLLKTKYSEKPIPEAVIDYFLADDNRQTRVVSWIHNLDHPFLRNLDFESKEFVQRRITELSCMPMLTLSYYRRKRKENYNVTVENIASTFARQIVKREKDFFLQGAPKTFVERYGKENANRELEQLLVHAFPKMTWRQQNAYLQRVQAIQTFFVLYRFLCHVRNGNQEGKRKVLEELLKSWPAPLSSKEKILAQTLMSNKDTNIDNVFDAILKLYTPTELSIAKVCYPLLADALEISATYIEEQGFFGREGELIGSYIFPLEELILFIVGNRLQRCTSTQEIEECKKMHEDCVRAMTNENFSKMVAKLPQKEFEDILPAMRSVISIIQLKTTVQDSENLDGLLSPSFFVYADDI